MYIAEPTPRAGLSAHLPIAGLTALLIPFALASRAEAVRRLARLLASPR